MVLTSGLDKVFCAGANIQMLAGVSHHHKVNFCKFTNETRAGHRGRRRTSGQVWLAAINGTAAGGGYELALACEEIILVDDRSSAVSLPEVPLLGVLPGTGGLTRLVDKRHVRRDLADVFATRAEGVQGQQALEWGLVDSTAPRSDFAEHVAARARARAAASIDRGGAGGGRPRPTSGWRPLPRAHRRPASAIPPSRSRYQRQLGAATLLVTGPDGRPAGDHGRDRGGRRRPGGRWPPAGSSTTPSCTCGSTSRSWAPGSSPPRATRAAVLRRRSSHGRSRPPLAGPARSGPTGSAPSSGSTSPPAAWSP